MIKTQHVTLVWFPYVVRGIIVHLAWSASKDSYQKIKMGSILTHARNLEYIAYVLLEWLGERVSDSRA